MTPLTQALISLGSNRTPTPKHGTNDQTELKGQKHCYGTPRFILLNCPTLSQMPEPNVAELEDAPGRSMLQSNRNMVSLFFANNAGTVYIYIYKHCCFHHLAVFIVRVGVICDFLVLAAWRRGHWQGVLPKSGSASAAFCLTVSLSPPSQQRCLQSARTRVCSSRRSRSSPPKRHPGWVGDPQAAWCPWWWGLGRGAQARAVTVAIATVATAKSTNRAPPPDPRLLTINGNTSLRQEERNPSPSDVQSSTLDIFLSSSHFGWSPRNGCDSCICTLQTWRWNGGSCDFRCQKIKNTGGYRKAWTWLERVLQVSCNSSGCTVLIAIDSQFLVT